MPQEIAEVKVTTTARDDTTGTTCRLKVLVVDDSPVARVLIGDLVRGIPGVQFVGSAGSVPEGLKKVGDFDPDLVTVDIRIGNDSGIELARAIKKKGDRPAVVMLTNYSFSSYRRQCEKIGVDYFLDKTVDLHRLREIVEHEVDRFNRAVEQSAPERLR